MREPNFLTSTTRLALFMQHNVASAGVEGQDVAISRRHGKVQVLVPQGLSGTEHGRHRSDSITPALSSTTCSSRLDCPRPDWNPCEINHLYSEIGEAFYINGGGVGGEAGKYKSSLLYRTYRSIPPGFQKSRFSRSSTT